MQQPTSTSQQPATTQPVAKPCRHYAVGQQGSQGQHVCPACGAALPKQCTPAQLRAGLAAAGLVHKANSELYPDTGEISYPAAYGPMLALAGGIYNVGYGAECPCTIDYATGEIYVLGSNEQDFTVENFYIQPAEFTAGLIAGFLAGIYWEDYAFGQASAAARAAKQAAAAK